jgi:hypothetical protein
VTRGRRGGGTEGEDRVEEGEREDRGRE